MVEFGLKLEDNKVDRWSNQYIDYEKLKAVLKRAKASVDYRDELAKRTPPAVVAEVREARRVGSSASSAKASDVDSSDRDASKPMNVLEFDKRSTPPFSAPPTPSRDDIPTDATPLLSNTKPPALKRQGSEGSNFSWGSNLNQTVSKVTSYLGLADDRALLLQAFEDTDDKLQLFKKSYDKELSKVKHFYNEKTNEISERMEILLESVSASGMKPKHKQNRRSSLVESMTHKFESMMHGIHHHARTSYVPDVPLHHSYSLEPEDDIEKRRKKEELLRKSDSIKRAVTDIYRTSKLLHNYSIMNYTGFVKIAKKFDKTFPDHKGMFKGNNCDDGKEAEVLAARMEKMYAKWFCEGDLKEAQAQLLPKKGDSLLMDWTQLRLGYRLGMCSILATWVAWDCVWGQFSRGEVSIGGRTAFPVFRACSGLLAWHWLWGMSVYVWTRYRINYIYLFDFDPRNVDTPLDIFNDAVDETLVFLICMLMYYKAICLYGTAALPISSTSLHFQPSVLTIKFLTVCNLLPRNDRIPPRAYPFFLICYTVKCLIFPWKLRKPLWVAIRQVVTSPLVSPTFFLTYVGDVFTSMVKVFQDILWTICYLASGDFLVSQVDQNGDVHEWTKAFWYKNVAIPFICLLPLLIRFNQCLRRYFDTGQRMPNLANAFKYAMSQSVTLFGAFHPLYMIHNRDEYKVELDGDDDEEKNLLIAKSSSVFQLFWLGLFVASSLYSFFWDVYMDWGLGRREYGFLGPRLMFPKKSQYYSVICADLVLRFMWVMTLIPPESGANFEFPQYLTAIQMVVELFRRAVWGFFRLEHEHRQNTQGFRRVNVVPLHFNTEHKHKYNERSWKGWQVLLEIVIVTSLVILLCACSVIAAQRATNIEQMPQPRDL